MSREPNKGVYVAGILLKVLLMQFVIPQIYTTNSDVWQNSVTGS